MTGLDLDPTAQSKPRGDNARRIAPTHIRALECATHQRHAGGTRHGVLDTAAVLGSHDRQRASNLPSSPIIHAPLPPTLQQPFSTCRQPHVYILSPYASSVTPTASERATRPQT